MKFMMTFACKPDPKVRDAAITRFRKTGGLPPDTAAKLLGRWTRADFSGGFNLLESDDAQAIAECAVMWSDLMDIAIIPVIEDKELSAVLERSGRHRLLTPEPVI